MINIAYRWLNIYLPKSENQSIKMFGVIDKICNLNNHKEFRRIKKIKYVDLF